MALGHHLDDTLQSIGSTSSQDDVSVRVVKQCGEAARSGGKKIDIIFMDPPYKEKNLSKLITKINESEIKFN